MTAEDVIGRMKACGARVIAGPRLYFPPETSAEDRAYCTLGAREHREAVLAEFGPKALVFEGEEAEMIAEVRRIGGEAVEPLIQDGNRPADLLKWLRDWDRARREEAAKWARWSPRGRA